MATKTRKPLQALGLADNFLFGEVMQDMGLCKLFLEALLQRPIAKIVNISKEKDLSDAYLAHGIRLDVDLEDENRTRYNIEMQGSSQKSIERRVSGELAKTAIKLCKEKKSDSETEARYMTLQMLLHDERAAAEAIVEARGEARGEIKGTLKTLISL